MKKLLTTIVAAASLLGGIAIPAGSVGAASTSPCMVVPALPPITASSIKAPAKVGARMDADNVWLKVAFGTVPNYTQYLVTTIAINPYSDNASCGTMVDLGTTTIHTNKGDKTRVVDMRMAAGPYVFVVQAKSADGTKVGQRTVIYGEFRPAPTFRRGCAIALAGLYSVAATSKNSITYLNSLDGWPKPVKAALASGQLTLELVELKATDGDIQAYLDGKLQDKVVSVYVSMVDNNGLTKVVRLTGQLSQFVTMMKEAEALGPSIREDCTW